MMAILVLMHASENHFVFKQRIVFKSIYIFHVCTPQRSLMMSVLVPCCVVVVIGKK